MTKAEQLKELAAQGMTAAQAVKRVGCHPAYARTAAQRFGFAYAPAKMGRPFGWRKAAVQPVAAPDLDLSAIEQMLADIAALPVAKRNDYRTLRVNHGVPHETVIAVLS